LVPIDPALKVARFKARGFVSVATTVSAWRAPQAKAANAAPVPISSARDTRRRTVMFDSDICRLTSRTIDTYGLLVLVVGVVREDQPFVGRRAPRDAARAILDQPEVAQVGEVERQRPRPRALRRRCGRARTA
jgi:hypothetical protein